MNHVRHPRRPPAHKSVSLRHSPPADGHSKPRHATQRPSMSPATASASDKANPPSTASPMVHKQSSGESSDAGKWFEHTNNAVHTKASFVDNDPPFFLRNSSSSETPPDGHDARSAPWRAHPTSLPYRPELMRSGTDGSSAEEFRGVIDDLTVANKKLKQRLRKYEKLYDAHLQDEKLFEVRFHGLPDHKKKELEETLRKFAADLDDHAPTEYPLRSYAAPLNTQKTASSGSHFADSAYASNSLSASGQNSTSASAGHESGRISKLQYNRQQQNVQSYLHDIPAGLMPKNTAAMSDKSRKKLVVRRLEQIYAGKLSVPGNHPQPMQQEEVAQSAAMADRRAKEATGKQARKEGLRVARIMPVRSEDEDMTEFGPPESLQRLQPSLAINEQDFAGSGSPDQRPTRPLDLDPYRAQVPAENMEYIRHLGFTPPDIDSAEGPEDGHGWIYLNLLINMAQLHTFNVTPDFVKDAVTEYSSKFELSQDGRKIRWKGGQEVTRNSDSSSRSGNSPYDVLAGSSAKSPTKWSTVGQNGYSRESLLDPDRQARRTARAIRERDQNKLAYTPIFFHRQNSEEDDVFNLDMSSSSNSPFPDQQRGDSSGFGSSVMRSSSSRKRREDGPMIFYNKAKFCTDLSGDRRGLSIANSTSYKSITTQPLGSTKPKASANVLTDINEPRGPMDATPMDLDPKGGEGPMSSEEEFTFTPSQLRNVTSSDSSEPMEFEASGLGGVQPDDNFAIKVRRSQIQTKPSAIARHRAKRSRLYPKKILEALDEQQSSSEGEQAAPRQVIKEEILSISRQSLPSSTLPPASYFPMDSASSGDVDSDLESDVSSRPSTSASSDQGPATALQFLNISPLHMPDPPTHDDGSSREESEEESDSSSNADSDDSVDMLATARKLDPRTVIASERAYDAAIAERLAEEIPAGSSAATAGGGSGFNTPAQKSAQGVEDAERARRYSQTSGSSMWAKNLKRMRTSDSIATALQSEKSQRLN